MTQPMLPRKKVEGKVAIITGGASGIGEGTARLFAEHGARMVVIADVQDELGQQVATSIGKQKCNYMHCDVTNEDQVKDLVEKTVQIYGQLDIMFSNAGIASRSDKTILDFDLDSYEKVFAVNVRGMAACVKHAARVMVERGVKGSIICTGSDLTKSGGDRFTAYVMSKGAVLSLVKSASRQLGRYGIRVNCVLPGPVATPLLCKTLGVRVEEAEKIFESSCCLKRMLKVKNVGDAVVFLACEDSEFITGLDLAVDGGFMDRTVEGRSIKRNM